MSTMTLSLRVEQLSAIRRKRLWWFRDHPAVINEVSQLFLDVFGEAVEHARVAFGVRGLPFNAPVEVQALFELQ
jgi:enamine deaminase RidA (YjgF/YER057c/UK114 family)